VSHGEVSLDCCCETITMKSVLRRSERKEYSMDAVVHVFFFNSLIRRNCSHNEDLYVDNSLFDAGKRVCKVSFLNELR